MTLLNKPVIITGLLIGVATVTSGLQGQPHAKQAPINKPQERANAAKRVYELRVEAPLAAGDPLASPEQTYIWSKRWLDAELHPQNDAKSRRKAAEAHLQRMISLEERVVAIHKLGAGTTIQVAAVEFYRIEAEELRDAQAK